MYTHTRRVTELPSSTSTMVTYITFQVLQYNNMYNDSRLFTYIFIYILRTDFEKRDLLPHNKSLKVAYIRSKKRGKNDVLSGYFAKNIFFCLIKLKNCCLFKEIPDPSTIICITIRDNLLKYLYIYIYIYYILYYIYIY